MSDARDTTTTAVGGPVSTPWVPLIASSVATALAALWLLQWLLALTVLSSVMPDGMKVTWPSGFEIAVLVTRRVGEPLLAVALLGATWRYGLRSQSRACWIAAAATVCISAASIVL